MEEIMKFVEENGLFGKVKWNSTDSGFKFFVECNDLFWESGYETEEVSEKDLTLFKSSLEDSKYGIELFCCRKRGMRPQGAFYRNLSIQECSMFDECGQPRATGHGNPIER